MKRCASWSVALVLVAAVCGMTACDVAPGGGARTGGDVDDEGPVDTGEPSDGGSDVTDPSDVRSDVMGSDGGVDSGLTRWGDRDGDGVPNSIDNCLKEENPQQADADQDGRGDACDNCPETPNYPQADADGDGTGDACESEPSGPICRTRESDFEIIKPNIYIVIDRSTSMRNRDDTTKTRMERAKEGLDLVGDKLADELRFGMSTYPCGEESAACSTLNYEMLSIGEHTASEFKASYGPQQFTDATCAHGDAEGLDGLDIETAGKHLTETAEALYDVYNRTLYEGSDDGTDRTSRVVLITDGNACGCADDDDCSNSLDPADEPGTIDALQQLRAAGVNTFVVGFNYESQLLNEAAEAGGTDANRNGQRYFSASNAQELVDALSDIRDRTIECDYELNPAPPDSTKLWVSVDGSYIQRSATNGYTYNASSAELSINGSACDTLRNAEGETVPLEIKMGCACEKPPCQCASVGEACSVDGDCCGAVCENGSCRDSCYPLGTSCQSDGDCCSANCTEVGDRKECLGG